MGCDTIMFLDCRTRCRADKLKLPPGRRSGAAIFNTPSKAAIDENRRLNRETIVEIAPMGSRSGRTIAARWFCTILNAVSYRLIPMGI
jgi:hypothetical protein